MNFNLKLLIPAIFLLCNNTYVTLCVLLFYVGAILIFVLKNIPKNF